jgi:hypothetical protein
MITAELKGEQDYLSVSLVNLVNPLFFAQSLINCFFCLSAVCSNTMATSHIAQPKTSSQVSSPEIKKSIKNKARLKYL